MTRTRNMADLLDSSGDIKSGRFDNLTTDVVGDTTPQLGGNLDTNSNNINFADNDKAQFGASNDLQIYHDGSNSFINDAGSGNLNIKGSAAVIIGKNGSTETMSKFTADGAVELYYDNSKKIETTSTGIDVTGTAEMDTLSIGGTAVTSTAAELNILDGVTATASELNILDGVTATAAELNILDGVTATAAELNILDGVTATTTELNYVDGVTSSIQTQIDNIDTDLSNDTTPQLGGNLDTNGNAILFGSSKWSIELDTGDNDLLFKYNGTTVFKLASNGAVTSADDVTAFGTP